MSDVPEVKVGETTYRIVPFRGFKGELAMALVNQVTDEAREVVDTVTKHDREWRAQNPLTITRQLCMERISASRTAAAATRELIAQAPEKVPDDEVKRLLDAGEPVSASKEQLEAQARFYDDRVAIWEDSLGQLGDEAFMHVPNPDGPPMHEVVLNAYPKAMAVAPDTVRKLLALVVIPNDDLRKADEEDRAIARLEELGKELFYEGLIEELMELAAVAVVAISAAVKKYSGPLGRIKAEVEELLGRRSKEPSSSAAAPTSPVTSPSDSPTGSTSSPTDTGGDETRSSGESAGASSLTSASA